MSREQRFFVLRGDFLGAACALVTMLGTAQEEPVRRGERIDLAGGRLSVILPDGWRKTDLNAGDVVAGYATQDERTSLFIREMDPGIGGGMQDLLDGTIANFEANFQVKNVGETRTGNVPGKSRQWPAIFTTIEATYAKSERESFEMRFYVFIFDLGEKLYFVQASTTKPIRESREAQVYEFLRAISANL